jgi:hypothetical protein
VNPRTFQEGDLVLRLKQGTEGRHKLTPPWEGPFIVSKALHNDAYYLIDAQAPKKNKVDRSGRGIALFRSLDFGIAFIFSLSSSWLESEPYV